MTEVSPSTSETQSITVADIENVEHQEENTEVKEEELIHKSIRNSKLIYAQSLETLNFHKIEVGQIIHILSAASNNNLIVEVEHHRYILNKSDL